ncbi:tRNA-dihydrouridine synthase family protein [Candidatus Woesearchaeota archaeon]|nr:tRNA-dihydrouridine synthase family protein [Candidatus Woesearchaeota archaeon]
MPKFQFMLAPLENTSDNAFRSLCYKYGADVTFTEMARIDALARGNKSTLDKIAIINNVPTWIQIVGAKEQKLTEFLRQYQPQKGFLGFNFNLGCPSPDIINCGLGSALIKRVSKVRTLLKTVEDFGFRTSIKMRLGLHDYEKEKKVYLYLIKDVDTDFFVVHPRTAQEQYETKPDETVYEECVATGKIIIANGDINTIEKVNELKALGLHGVMIGRNAVYDPAIFNRLKGLGSPSFEDLKKEYLKLCNHFHTSDKYKTNVLGRIGKTELTDKTKAQLMRLVRG